MSDLVRRLVSGRKSRFKDDVLNIDLDLVYLTDRIIIMGYPAIGLEGLYRNRREDAVRFLQHRHAQNYWVFNFCPIKENSYDPAVFDSRVSRYPFPDHHAPPLAILPLASREMHAWLQGSADRIIVLHCKAGKGRSGTMACAYLLAHERIPSPPKLQRSYSTKEWLKRQIQETIHILPPSDDESTAVTTPAVASHTIHSLIPECSLSDAEGLLDIEKGGPPLSSPFKSTPNPEISFTDALKGVLDLHTARRMKISSEVDEPSTSEKPKKVSQGVSIPSQRRFLYYWALVLAQQAPKLFWPVERIQNLSENGTSPFRKPPRSQTKVRLTQIKLRMRDSLKVAMGVVKAVNLFIDKTEKPGSSSVDSKEKEKAWATSRARASQIWVSLARYDDNLIDLLEEWEVHTRDASGDMARRRPSSVLMNRSGLSKRLDEIFSDGKWDKQKMVRTFARLRVIDDGKMEKDVDKETKIRVYTLRPIATKSQQVVSVENDQKIAEGKNDNHGVSIQTEPTPTDNTLPTPTPNPDQGITLDAGREVRLKLYMGQMFMGWAWFIPAFHMPEPPSPSASSECSSSSPKTTLVLQRKDIDFAIGIGSAIIDVEIDMEWIISS